jgi:choline-sulfatase
MSDEHRADVTGFEGNSVIRTPNLDRLASNSVIFGNAYTPSPICIPARQCMMSGQLPRTCGVEVFGEDLPPQYMTFARRFSQYAYETVVCGKLHHMGQDQMQGWNRRIGMDDMITTRYIEGKQEEQFKRFILPQETNWGDDVKVIQRSAAGKAPYFNRDEYTVDGTIRFIEEYFVSPVFDRSQVQRPLLLKVSLVQPHFPYNTDEKRFSYYINRIRPYLNEQVSEHVELSRRQVRPGVDVSEREICRATAVYYGMVESMDEHLGQVLEALEHVGQNLDDWIIVYTSDHGEMLGEHGVWEKKSFYEGSVRVPLFIRWPERFGYQARMIKENVNLCDLFATLCDLADIPAPEGLDSRSLVPLMMGSNKEWPNESVSQYNGKEIMIKRDALKYMYYGPDVEEVLFDLSVDPEEKVNRVAEEAYSYELANFRKRRKSCGFH